MSALRIAEDTRRPFFTVKSLAKYLSVSERTVFGMLADGTLPSYKIANSRRIDPEDIDRYLQTHRFFTSRKGLR